MEVLTRVEPNRLHELLARDTFFWLDLRDPTDADIDHLGELFGLTDLARKDSKNFEQRPKVDDFGDHLLIVLYSVERVPEDPEREWRPLEVHLYVSGAWVVSIRRGPCELLDRTREELAGTEVKTEMRALWRVLRALTDAYEPALEEIEARVDRQEALVFQRIRQARLETLYHLRQETNDLLRRAAAQRDIWEAGARRLCDLEGLQQDPRPLLDDIGDQLAEVAGELERHHSDASTLVTVYFSASGERLNRIATRLTILATFFLAWTLVTGFFGQNFGWLVDNIDSRTDFLIWGVGGLLAATLVAWLVVWWGERSG
jgi:magnesium transporter